MSTIGSISNSGYSNYSSTIQKQRPDPAAMADSVFSKLDTKGQGYLEVSDLESAFSKISSNTNSTTSTTSTNNTSSTSSKSNSSATSNTTDSSTVSNLFKTLDSNSDGKVTKDEFSSGLKKLSDALESQFNARRTSSNGGGQMPPPPDGATGTGGAGGAGDAGLSQSQLSDLATKVSNTDSAAGSSLSTVAKNFDAADTNQDGKVSLKETLAYLEKVASTSGTSTQSTSSNDTSSSTAVASTGSTSNTSSSGTSSSSSTSTSSNASSSDSSSSSTTTDAAMFKKVMQLLHAYSDPFQNTQSNTTNISVSA
ncbi:EF-hand domain-containing protein [Undibacterium sp. SXout7W]|uniref:EF-hand domain-containing protein n=1 Tax=Undibacterium sp. SXout7W TaxID=3413049 RepID=UPI003BF05925